MMYTHHSGMQCALSRAELLLRLRKSETHGPPEEPPSRSRQRPGLRDFLAARAISGRPKKQAQWAGEWDTSSSERGLACAYSPIAGGPTAGSNGGVNLYVPPG